MNDAFQPSLGSHSKQEHRREGLASSTIPAVYNDREATNP